MNTKRRCASLAAILFCLTILLVSSPAWSGKLYKWVDKSGQVHYTQTPPPKSQVKNPRSQSEEQDDSEISAIRKGSYAYCGEMKLPGPLNKPKDILSGLESNITLWTLSLKQNEHSLSTQLRALENKKGQDSAFRSERLGYTDIAGDRRKKTQQKIKEYRCALAWAEVQKTKHSGDKKETTISLKEAEANYKAAHDEAYKDCGFEPKDYTDPAYNNKKAKWEKCMQPHDKKIREAEKIFQKLRNGK